jgi:hypothetical protein
MPPIFRCLAGLRVGGQLVKGVLRTEELVLAKISSSVTEQVLEPETVRGESFRLRHLRLSEPCCGGAWTIGP